MQNVKNVLGSNLQCCSKIPLTGFYRDGYCRTGTDDKGNHVVASVMTREFLKFTKLMGNDLSTPNPAYGFPGLKVGDRWCLCAVRWNEAYNAGCAPPVILESTNEHALRIVDLSRLIEMSHERING